MMRKAKMGTTRRLDVVTGWAGWLLASHGAIYAHDDGQQRGHDPRHGEQIQLISYRLQAHMEMKKAMKKQFVRGADAIHDPNRAMDSRPAYVIAASRSLDSRRRRSNKACDDPTQERRPLSFSGRVPGQAAFPWF